MKKLILRFSSLFLFFCSLFAISTNNTVMAHSGGTDAAGCHGGSQPYHCHSGSSYSPYKAPSYNYNTPNFNYSDPYKAPTYNYNTPTIKPYKAPTYNYNTPTIKPYKAPTYKPYKAPTYGSSRPTAICGDYSFSYSKSRSGACSGHRGVLVWGGS